MVSFLDLAAGLSFIVDSDVRLTLCLILIFSFSLGFSRDLSYHSSLSFVPTYDVSIVVNLVADL